jgi:hypothetical protein
MLHGVVWRLVTDVSGKHVVSLRGLMSTELTCNEMLVTNYQPMPCHIPDERRRQQHCIVGLKFCILQVVNFQSLHLPALLEFCLVVTIYTFLNYVYCAHLYKEASIGFIKKKFF